MDGACTWAVMVVVVVVVVVVVPPGPGWTPSLALVSVRATHYPRIRPLGHGAAMVAYKWKQVEVKTADFHRCPAYATPSSWDASGLWELKTFHAHLYTMKMHRWMTRGGQPGGERLTQMASMVAAGLDCQWHPPRKCVQSRSGQAAGHGATAKSTAAGEPPALFGYAVSTPSLLLYMLLACPPITSTTPGRARRSQLAMGLLQHIVQQATATPSSVDFPTLGQCTIAGGRMTCSDASLQHLLLEALGGAPDHGAAGLEAGRCMQLCQQAVCHGTGSLDMDIAKEVCGTLLCHLTACVDAWAHALPPASVHIMLHTHLRGRKRALRGNPGLKCALAKKRRMNMANRDWADDAAAGHGAVDVKATLEKVCCHHYQVVRRIMSPQTVIELCLDASRFATRDTEVVVCYCSAATGPAGNPGTSSQGVAAFLPPLSLPELSWRIGIAGTKISPEEREYFEQHGFQQKAGMPTRAYLQLINQSLGHIGKKLIMFQGPMLCLMPSGGVRFWSPQRRRWMRAPPAGPGGSTPPVPELPDNMLDMKGWATIPVLLLTLDQASTGWSACHFLSWPGGSRLPAGPGGSLPTQRRRRTLPRTPGGMNLLLLFLTDPYHRSWNDFKWACKHAMGHMNSSILQMMVVYNHNYQPYLNGANLGKKKEFLADFQQLFPRHGHEWEEVVSNLGSIATAEHGVEFGGGAASVQQAAALYTTLVLQCRHFQDTDVHNHES